MARKKKEDFDVVTASQTEDGTLVITTAAEFTEEQLENVIKHAVATYDPENKQYATYLKISASSETMTVDRVDELARVTDLVSGIKSKNSDYQNHKNDAGDFPPAFFRFCCFRGAGT